MTTVHVYILCYNEEVLIADTIKHYRDNFKDCSITILDNYSSDNSVSIAKNLNCSIRQWKSPRYNGVDEKKYIGLKNRCWRNQSEDWVIVCDMDEWLDVNSSDLSINESLGFTVLSVQAFQMFGESLCDDLSDIDLFNVQKCYKISKDLSGLNLENYNKKCCFNSKFITDVKYSLGAHDASFTGSKIEFSKNIYPLKHMNFLGESYYFKKITQRYDRSKDQKKDHPKWATQYINNKDEILKVYQKHLSYASLNYDDYKNSIS
tara:strand:- start:52 stop:837 length:786 start_codon:yes stop_codon:yes gene_type:complete